MVDETMKCIRESMLSLLEEKEYSKIQMKEVAENAHVGRKTLYRYFENKEQIVKYIAESLMDRFTKEIQAQDGLNLQNVTKAFFVFIQNNRDEFVLLKKARLLSYIEDNLFELVTQVAAETKYKDKTLDEIKEIQKMSPAQDKYALHYTLAGYWCMAMVWISTDDSLTPEQMSEIAVKIMTGKV